jgi:agmatine deiminase
MLSTKKDENSPFFLPAEWESHFGCFVAYPYHAFWSEHLASAQKEFTAFCQQICESQEKLFLLTPPTESAFFSEIKAAGFLNWAYDDIWLRDTGCIFGYEAQQGSRRLIAWNPQFNGWGGKYQLSSDEKLGPLMASFLTKQSYALDFILEGGSIESNGKGLCLTSEQCLLNPNRNKNDKQSAENQLMRTFGFQKILWVKEGLKNDHTDGHIDTLVRFISEDTLLCMQPVKNDPNEKCFLEIIEQCSQMQDQKGKKLKVLTVSSPGLITSGSSEILPASYLNFYIANDRILVPLYGSEQDAVVIDQMQKIFDSLGYDRKVIGLSARSILEGGGAFHCITQPIPLIF